MKKKIKKPKPLVIILSIFREEVYMIGDLLKNHYNCRYLVRLTDIVCEKYNFLEVNKSYLLSIEHLDVWIIDF